MSGSSPALDGPHAPGGRLRSAAPLLVVLAAVVAHAAVLRGGLFEPDEYLVLAMGQTYAAAPAAAMVGAAEPDATRFAHRRLAEIPLFTALHGLLGYHAAAYRALGLALHALAAVLVLLLARRLGLDEACALLAGLMFAVYPKAFEVTALLSSLPWALAAVLLLGALLLYLGHEHRARPRLALAGSALLLGVAVLLRGAFAVLVPAALALDLVRRLGWRGWRQARAWRPLAPLLLVAAAGAAMILRNEIALTGQGVPPGDLEVLTMPGQLLYRLLVSLPASLLFLADPARLPGLTWISGAWAALAVGLVLAAMLRRRMPWHAAGLGLILMLLLLAPTLIVIGPGELGEARHQYLAGLGLALVLASALKAVDRWPRLRALLVAALLLVPATANVGSQLELYERAAPAQALAGSVAALARTLPRGARLVLLDGGPADRNAREAAMLAAWLARPEAGLTVVQVERPRVCTMPEAARLPAARGADRAVYWWDGQLASSDLMHAARLLATHGCAEPPGPDDEALVVLPGDPSGRALIGRRNEHSDFCEYAWRH